MLLLLTLAGLTVPQIPPHLVEGLTLPLVATPPRAHPRPPTRCVAQSGGGGGCDGDLRWLGQIVWICTMWWLAPCVNIDLNIVVVVVVNARQPFVASGNTGGCCMLSVDMDDDDARLV
jgi:hypothetical protein